MTPKPTTKGYDVGQSVRPRSYDVGQSVRTSSHPLEIRSHCIEGPPNQNQLVRDAMCVLYTMFWGVQKTYPQCVVRGLRCEFAASIWNAL